jgi:osmotically-inducible protein OsmY
LQEDRQLEHDVRAELKFDQDVTHREFVDVVVDGGIVYLLGFSDSYAQKWAIEQAARRVVGVTDLRSRLQVRPSAAAYRSDAQIQKAAEHALQWDARVPRGVRATATDAVVRLYGMVDRSSQLEAAEEAVRNLVGVRDVMNEIRVVPAPSSEDREHDPEPGRRW